MPKEGTIVSINTRAQPPEKENEPHLPAKYPAHHGKLGQYGFEGDFHNRMMRRSFSKPGTLKPNTDRHVSMLALEVIEEMNLALELNLGPGTLGENVTTRGLGDLSDIAPESRLVVLSGADDTAVCTLRVVEQNMPCVNLSLIHNKLAKHIMGKRGILCAIEVNLYRRVCANDRIVVIPPGE